MLLSREGVRGIDSGTSEREGMAGTRERGSGKSRINPHLGKNGWPQTYIAYNKVVSCIS
jgi:hypothetical protein